MRLNPPPPASERVEYYHLDTLGSVRAITNEQGEVIARHDFLPFGEEWSSAGGTNPVDRRLFTGKERDAELDLDYFGARYQRAGLGRFTTVDPAQRAMLGLADPQRWNRYAYAKNNPLRFVDPDGRWAIDVHLYLTAALAYASGASRSESDLIGRSDQWTDDNPATQPESTDRSHYKYHFSTELQAYALLFSAGEAGSESFGYALHAYQDSFIHPHDALVSLGKHILLDVDGPSKHPEEALAMAKGTYDILKGSIDGLPAVSWSVLEPLVKKFIAETDPKKKAAILDNIHFLANDSVK